MSLLVRGARVLVPSGLVHGADVLADGGRVRAVGARLKAPRDAEVVEARGAMLAPGLVDLQINGAYGVNFSEASPAEVVRAAVRLAGEGVTSFLPTLISLPLPRLEAALGRLYAASRLGPGARVAGVHVEGPFLSKARRGAHRAANLRRPSVREFERVWRASRGLLRVLTLAPEAAGAASVLAAARRRGVLVSLGHTDAGAAEVDRAASAGARLVTHLFNAMAPFHHRAESAVSAFLTDDRLACGLIYDGNHVGPRAAALALKAKGPEGLFLVSDAVFALGLKPGRYRADGTDYELSGGRFCVRGGPLGGAVRSLRDCVARFARDLRVPLGVAWRLGSESPGRLLGKGFGVLAAGAPADLALVAPDGAVRASWVGGTRWK